MYLSLLGLAIAYARCSGVDLAVELAKIVDAIEILKRMTLE